MNRVNICHGATGQRGFTLIELMVIVAIVAILTSVAVPAYRNHVIKSNRAAAEAVMLQIANQEEQVLLNARQYLGGAAFSTTVTSVLVNVPVPDKVRTNYTISVASPTPGSLITASFTITAAPIGAQQNDSCGTLTLDQTGQKNAIPGPTATCW